jgi:ATP-dependent helicase/nuclease subunit A
VSDVALRMDVTARERIEHDLDTSFLVEAGAGSGKTTSIVARMLSLIESGKAEVQEIAAITFTNKAAAELRSRFRLRLEQRLRAAAEPAVRFRLEQALARIAEGFVGTIHSFCGRLLRERPMEAGLDPLFTEIDEAENRERLDRYWDDFLLEERERLGEAPFESLARLGVHVEELRAVFLCAAMYEDVEVFTRTTERPEFDYIRLSLLPLIEEAARALPTNRPDGGWDPLQQAVRSALSFRRTQGMEDDVALLSLASSFDRVLHVTQKRWPDPKEAKALKEKFAEWRRLVLQPFLQAWKEHLHPQMVRFVLPAVAYARERRQQEGALSFQDLLMKSTALLRKNAVVRHYFASRYTRLFVDEFQDTDPVQAEMMLLLTGDDASGNDWRQRSPKPGSLFIVGDPKQSIYRFRRADISTYNLVKRIVAKHGDVLQLTQNFRSVKGIGDFVNYAFEGKFLPPGKTDDHQAGYVKMLTTRENPKGQGLLHGVYTMTASKAEYDRKADIAAADAERTARWIAWACDGHVSVADRDNGKEVVRPVRPDDVLILLRYREFIGLYAEKLEAYGIPADTSGSQVMYEELRMLHLLACCLHDPSDRVPLLAVLRGILFGISDESLFVYTKEVGRLSLFLPMIDRENISETARPAYDALHRLREYLSIARREPALSAFQRIVEKLGVIPFAAVQPSGSIRSGTLMKLMERIAEAPEAVSDWSGLTKLLGGIAEANGLEGTSLFTGSGYAVRIMNLHKAKGLEAPIVFLSGPCGDSDRDASEHIDRMSEPAVGYFTITRRMNAYQIEVVAQPVGWPELSEKERLYMQAEKDRLLYVAATRAKQLMIVSRYPYKPAIDPWSSLDAALKGQLELDDAERSTQPRETWEGPFEALDELKSWNDRRLTAALPSYQVASVTATVKQGADTEALPRPADGRGIAFGNVVHRCLERIGNRSEQSGEVEMRLALARSTAAEEGVDPALLEDAVAMLEDVTASELWRRALKAKRRYHEFTFTVTETVEGFDRVLNGVIDLVFEEEDGWVIVDFKTDAYALEQESLFIRYYEPQVMVYADCWRRMTRMPVKETGLYFVNTNQYVLVNKGTNAP